MKKKPLKCPYCGDTHIIIWRSTTREIKPKYYCACRYCDASAKSAWTKRGAIRKFRKLTNVIRIGEVEEYRED